MELTKELYVWRHHRQRDKSLSERERDGVSGAERVRSEEHSRALLALSAAASLLLSAAAAVLSSIASSPVAPVKCSFSSFVLLSNSGVFLSCLSLSSPHLLLLLFFMIILLFFWCSSLHLRLLLQG